jgi:hypothetical protein
MIEIVTDKKIASDLVGERSHWIEQRETGNDVTLKPVCWRGSRAG